MIKADISHFIAPYEHLNIIDEDINISRLMLALSVMSVGQSCLHEVLGQGFWRLCYLFSLTYGHVYEENGYLKLSDSFKESLDSSEKRTVCYHLGMGLAKACASSLLNIPWLSHLRHVPGVHLYRELLQNTSKLLLYSTDKIAREPDLIGFDNNGQPHVIEAKGYSSGFNSSEFQHAIDQVSQVIDINGVPPRTKVVTFFDMSGLPIKGFIVDPNESQQKGISIELKFDRYISEYYSSFQLDSDWFQAPTIKLFDRNFKIRAIGTPDYYYGIDEEIFNSLFDDIDALNATDFFCKNYKQINYGNQKNEMAIGMDGTVLIQRKNKI